MKRLLGFVAAVSILTVFACNKENDVENNTFSVSISADKDDSATKGLSLEGHTLHTVWKAGEQVTVVNFTKFTPLGGYLEVQTPGSATTNLAGTLTGTIEVGDKLLLEFLTPDFGDQDGTLEYIESHCDYATAYVTVTSIEGGKITTTAASFANQRTIVKFILLDDHSEDLYPERFTVQAGASSYIRFFPSTGSNNEFFVCFPGISSQEVDLVATQFGLIYTYVKSDATFNNGKYYEIRVRMSPKSFSVGDALPVWFSQGNLKYDGSKWYFHKNQWYCVHPYGYSADSYPMDLFTWGNIASPAFNGNTYITGTDNLSYGSGTDWGSNPIVNGGNGGVYSGWSTLLKEQWDYLLHDRTDAIIKFGIGSVAGMNGMIILPDDYSGPALNTSRNAWNNNTITASEWARYEAHGAVFLPAAGLRNQHVVYNVGEMGLYWSGTAFIADSEKAYELRFSNLSKEFYTAQGLRSDGESVRLVKF